MRRIIAYALLAVVLSAFVLASLVQADVKDEDKPLVVVTISPLYLIAKEVVGPNAEIHVLAPAGVDPHSYSPTPEDVMMVSSCDLFICIGREEFLGQLPIPEHGLILSWDSWINGGVYVKDDNPHYLWLYPPNAKTLATIIAEAMSSLNPDSSNYYTARADAFAHKINDLETWLKAVMKDIGNANVVLAGDHFEPLVEWMGLNVSYIIIKGHGGLPGPQRIKDAIIAAKTSKLIIASATQSEGYEGLYAQQVSAESGVPVAYVYGIPISMSDSYIEFIKYDVMIIASHLRHNSPINSLTFTSSEDIYMALTILFASIAVFEGIIISRLRSK
ncbi:MAG: metal ABC transporter substrate-binding protein [Candidatus Nezhaarchaeales archaeon]